MAAAERQPGRAVGQGRAALEDGGDLGAELGLGEGLGDEAGGPGGGGLVAGGAVVGGRHDQDREDVHGGLAEAGRELDGVDAREVEVDQDQVGALGPDHAQALVEGGLAAGGGPGRGRAG
jgi:hypothetical protein